MTNQPNAPAAVDLGAAAPTTDLPLIPLPPGAIPDAFAKNVDPMSPPPMRMMAARAMAPIPPRALVPVIYQLMMDPDEKIAAAARKSFRSLDDKLLTPALAEPLAPQILEALCHTLTANFGIAEKVLLNRATPDAGFVWMAEHAEDEKLINVVVENQERLLRAHDIVRGLKKNPRCLRSDLDRAVDFLVREGVFLDDVSEFEDSFVRLGKSEMLAAMKKVRVREALFSAEEAAAAAAEGMSPEELALRGDGVSREEIDALLEDDEPAQEKENPGRKRWMDMTKGEKMKFAMQGGLEYALEAIKSPNKALSVAGINNPKLTESDIPKIIRSKSLCDDVVRVICNNGDWTKSYEIKKGLIEHPKTPISLVLRWLPLMREADLRGFAKSKQISSNVAQQAKRLLDQRGR